MYASCHAVDFAHLTHLILATHHRVRDIILTLQAGKLRPRNTKSLAYEKKLIQKHVSHVVLGLVLLLLWFRKNGPYVDSR